MIVALDHFVKECWSVLGRLRENLKQVALFVVVYQNFELLELVDVFRYLQSDFGKAGAEVVVICVWNLVQKLYTACLHCLDSRDDIVCAHRNVLHSGATVVFDVFLNLAFSDSVSRLVDWHLDSLVEISNDDGTER